MKIKILGITLAFVGLVILVGCSATPILNGGMQPSISLNLGPGPSVRGVSVNDGSARFLASDNASATVTVRTAGLPDLTYAFSPSAGSVTIQVTRGLHTFVVNTYDSKGNLLTSGTTSMDVGSGSNSLSLTLTGTAVGVSGIPINLAAGQVKYFTIPGDSYGISSTCISVAGAPTARFWVCAADGSFSGSPSSISYFYTYTSPAPATFLIRAENTGLSAGTLSF